MDRVYWTHCVINPAKQLVRSVNTKVFLRVTYAGDICDVRNPLLRLLELTYPELPVYWRNVSFLLLYGNYVS
jgi:hypothetical protein